MAAKIQASAGSAAAATAEPEAAEGQMSVAEMQEIIES